MATTSIMPLHTGKGQTMKRALLQNKKARDTLSRAFLLCVSGQEGADAVCRPSGTGCAEIVERPWGFLYTGDERRKPICR